MVRYIREVRELFEWLASLSSHVTVHRGER